MVNYLRDRTFGATYFFTVTLRDRTSHILVENIDYLRQAVREVRINHPFEIDAMVVLPEHLHAIFTLPEHDADYSTRLRLIKKKFTMLIGKSAWQARFWEHRIRDDLDFERHVDYIHFNPVKHGYVKCVADWPHSSFHRYVREGKLASDWGGSNAIISGGLGEPQ